MKLLSASLKTAALAFFTFNLSPLAAQKKVEGLPYVNGRLVSSFAGDQFTLIKSDGYVIYNLEGTVVAQGIKAVNTGFSDNPVELRYGGYFAQQSDKNILLKRLDKKPVGQEKYKRVHRFITDNTAVEIPMPVTQYKFAYIDTLGKVISTVDAATYFNALGISAKKDFSVWDRFTLLSSFFAAKDFKPFNEGLTTILDPRKELYGFVDPQFKLVIPALYTAAESFFEGKAAVMNNDKQWGFINKKAELVIPYNYSKKPSRFSSGLAKVSSKNNLYGYINAANEVVIQPKYQYATDFYKGFALVRESYDTAVLLIDASGKVISSFDPKYGYFNSAAGSFSKDAENPYHFPETLVQLVDEGKGVFNEGEVFGILDKAGNIVLNFDYRELKDYHNGKMIAHWSKFIDGKTQHKYGIINEKGDFLIEFVDSVF